MLSLPYDRSNSFLLKKKKKIYELKAKDSEIKLFPLCSGNNSKGFVLDNMKKIELKGDVKAFSVDYDPINTSDILDIHRFSMKET